MFAGVAGSVGGRRAASRVSRRASEGDVARRLARLSDCLLLPFEEICSPSRPAASSSEESLPSESPLPPSPSDEPMTIMGALCSCRPPSFRSGLPVRLRPAVPYRGERLPAVGGVAPPFRRDGESDDEKAREPKVAS